MKRMSKLSLVAMMVVSAACGRGTGQAPTSPSAAPVPSDHQGITASVTSIDFGEVLVNTTASREVTITLERTGTTNFTVTTFSDRPETDISPPFDVQATPTCTGRPIPRPCNITVTFTPTAAGVVEKVLLLGECTFDPVSGGCFSSGLNFLEVPLKGTGVTSFPADLAISISGSVKPLPGPKLVPFSIIVQNLGPRSAPGVVVTDILPSGSQFLSVTTTQGTCTTPPVGATGSMTCTLGTVPAGGTATLSLILNSTIKKGILQNTASVSADSTITDTNPANNTATADVQIK